MKIPYWENFYIFPDFDIKDESLEIQTFYNYFKYSFLKKTPISVTKEEFNYVFYLMFDIIRDYETDNKKMVEELLYMSKIYPVLKPNIVCEITKRCTNDHIYSVFACNDKFIPEELHDQYDRFFKYSLEKYNINLNEYFLIFFKRQWVSTY